MENLPLVNGRDIGVLCCPRMAKTKTDCANTFYIVLK